MLLVHIVRNLLVNSAVIPYVVRNLLEYVEA